MKRHTASVIAVVGLFLSWGPDVRADVSLVDGSGLEYFFLTDVSGLSSGTSSLQGCWTTSTTTSWGITCTPTTYTTLTTFGNTVTLTGTGTTCTTTTWTSTWTWITTCATPTTTIPTTFENTNYGSGVANEASYTKAVTGVTTSGGGTTTTTLSDAFDGYNGVRVNDVMYQGNGVAALEDDNREVVTNPQVIGNLTVQRKVYVPSNDAFARWLNIVTNNGPATEQVNMLIANDLGSDNDTTIEATSSGDTDVTVDDDWAVTNGDFWDPRLAHVFQGPGAPVRTAAVYFHVNWDEPVWRYVFDLGPGQTAIIMNLVSGQPSVARATTKAQELVALPNNTLAGMSEQEAEEVVNFVVLPEYQACCLPDGSCEDELAATCTANGGTPQGPGTDCATTDCVPPTITDITSASLDSPPSYGIGAAIDVTVDFSEPVTLAGGTLDVTLDTGAVVNIPAFGPANTVSAVYVVGAGENSLDLAVAGPLALAGGATLTDGAGNAADLTLPAGQTIADLKDIVVDGDAPTLDAAVSRKTHGAVGDFDIDLPLDPADPNDVAVETRSGGLTTVVFTFSEDVQATDATPDETEVGVDVGGAPVVGAVNTVVIAGAEMTVTFIGIASGSCVDLTITGIEDLAGNALAGDNDVRVRVLAGDLNHDGTVNAVDLAGAGRDIGLPLDVDHPENAGSDVNIDGAVDATDMARVKRLIGGLAVCP